MGEKFNVIEQRKSPVSNKTRHEGLATILAIVSVLSTAILFSSCGPRAETGAADNPEPTTLAITTASAIDKPPISNRLDNILEKGEIIVAMSPDFAPMEFIDSRKNGQDQYVGADPWFAKYIADELGVSLRISAMSFNALETAVISGEADLIISGFAATEKRAEIFELSDFYNIISDDGSGLIVLKDATENYQTAANFAGKKVAVQTPSAQYNLLMEQLPDAKPEPIEHINDGVMMLLTKKADAMAVDGANGRIICENYPDLAMSGFVFDYQFEGNVVCMQKGEAALLNRINEIIKKATAADMFGIWLKDAKALVAEIGWQD